MTARCWNSAFKTCQSSLTHLRRVLAAKSKPTPRASSWRVGGENGRGKGAGVGKTKEEYRIVQRGGFPSCSRAQKFPSWLHKEAMGLAALQELQCPLSGQPARKTVSCPCPLPLGVSDSVLLVLAPLGSGISIFVGFVKQLPQGSEQHACNLPCWWHSHVISLVTKFQWETETGLLGSCWVASKELSAWTAKATSTKFLATHGQAQTSAAWRHPLSYMAADNICPGRDVARPRKGAATCPCSGAPCTLL